MLKSRIREATPNRDSWRALRTIVERAREDAATLAREAGDDDVTAVAESLGRIAAALSKTD